MKYFLLTLLISFLFSTFSFSQATKEDITTSFFDAYKKDPLKAYDKLFSLSQPGHILAFVY